MMDGSLPDAEEGGSISPSVEEEDEDAKDRGSSTESAVSNPGENELINLDEIELSDEDTWLYTSPNGITSEEKGLSPYKWLRKDVEDPNKRELQIAKTALVNKLDELEILKAAQKTPKLSLESTGRRKVEKPFRENESEKDGSYSLSEEAPTIKDSSTTNNSTENQCSPLSSDTPPSEEAADDVEKKSAAAQSCTNAMDIFERARLQEESLKESSSRFFSQATRTFPRGTRTSTTNGANGKGLQKPASVEVLHSDQVDVNYSVPSSLNIAEAAANVTSLSQSPFGSTISLSFNPESHRSSLPNLNKGYYSLKSKKPKRTSEPRIQCPLPTYPRPEVNGTNREVPRLSVAKASCQVLSDAVRESQTLPSSYRAKSKSATNHTSTLPRRDSAPAPQVPRNHAQMQAARQESMPCIAQLNDVPNGRPQPYQSSPRKNSAPTSQHFGGSTTPLHNVKSVSLNHLPREARISPIKEYPRQMPQSKRQPLTSMHNYSPDKEDCPVVQRNGDLKKSSLPSKIPGTIPRSGIPVPSTHFAAKSNHANGSWNRDFY